MMMMMMIVRLVAAWKNCELLKLSLNANMDAGCLSYRLSAIYIIIVIILISITINTITDTLTIINMEVIKCV